MIYCVEDDENIRELIVYTLNVSGYNAIGFSNGSDFYEEIKNLLPDLIILDIMLPEEDGIQILGKLKRELDTKDIPIIMVTAKNSEYDKVKGLDKGADDYITKPIAMMEFLSRVKAVLRRSNKNYNTETTIKHNCLQFDEKKHQVFVNNKEILLTFKEFELLKYLLENKGLVLSRDKLLETIWGYEYQGETRTVDVHIRSLRQKLTPYDKHITTVRGIGYKIE